MSKLAVLPSAKVTPEMILDLVRDRLPAKSIYMVIERDNGEWSIMHTSCTVAELCFAGTMLQNKAVRSASVGIE